MKLFVYFAGKPKDAHANALAGDYLTRVDRYARAEMREIRPGDEWWKRHPAAFKILLDPGGREMASDKFAALVGKCEMEGRDMVFAVGGHDGVPDAWRSHGDLVLSLSKMTWPHELARAMLAEQLYRAFAILRNHPYPR